MDETGDAEIHELGGRIAPWGKELRLQRLDYESGMRLIRLRIREGHRFTILDLDAATLQWLTETAAQALPEA